MALRLTEEQQLLRVAVREFAEAEIRPHVMAWDEAQAFPLDLLQKLAAQGLMGVQVPEALGGSGMSAVAYCVCIEELARVDPSIALSVAAHNGLCVAHLQAFGDDDQRERFLRPLPPRPPPRAWGPAVSQSRGAGVLPEASSGSDAAAMRTTATRDGRDWVLNGSKQFITHGRIGGTIVVMAVTDQAQGAPGSSGLVV